MQEKRGGEIMSAPLRTCPWDGKPVLPRKSGGKPKRFCGEECKRRFEKSLRVLSQQRLEKGAITMADLRAAFEVSERSKR